MARPSATARELILRFEGCYHGSYDLVANDRRGVSSGTTTDAVILPVGDADAVVAALDQVGERIAAVIIDALPGRAGMQPASPEFMRFLREQTEAREILLIQTR
jgi:glutamate-1-semialdehyde 2,1-aminomutase